MKTLMQHTRELKTVLTRLGAAAFVGLAISAAAAEEHLVVPEGLSSQLFGWSVAMSGRTAVAGANTWTHSPPESPGEYTLGSAHVYERIGSTWSHVALLSPDDEAWYEEFGASVDVNCDTIVVGAPGGPWPQGAYVFERIDGTWARTARLDNQSGSGRFGHAVATTGSFIVIGDPEDDDEIGSASVFVREGAGWAFAQKLQPEDLGEWAWFGWSVAASGSRILIGAVNDGPGHSGRSYVFDRVNGEWEQTAVLEPSDGVSGFGLSVALDGSRAAVGAPSWDSPDFDDGVVHVFDRDGSGWNLSATLGHTGGSFWGVFGETIGLDGDLLAVGVKFDDDHGEFSGSVYAYRRSNGSWAFDRKYVPDDVGPGHRFGFRVAVSDGTIMASATGDETVYLFMPPGVGEDVDLVITSSDPAEALPVSGLLSWQTEQLNAGPPEEGEWTTVPRRPHGGDEIAFRCDCTDGPADCEDVHLDDPLSVAFVSTLSHIDGVDEVTYDNCGSAFFRWTFDMPAHFTEPSLSGIANVDDQGVLFLNGHAVTGLMTETGCEPDPGLGPDDPCYGMQDAGFDRLDANGRRILTWPTTDWFFACEPEFFQPGTNQLVFAIHGDASYFEPTGVEFRIRVSYQLACPFDLDGSGVVDFQDLLALLHAWGECEACPADLSGDGWVDIADLLILLTNWGPCA